MNEVEEIKNRLNIAEVISEYIQLIPAGTNLKARCPFHNEKTPSFFVSPEKQIWHCFGCFEGGDVFTFVQKMEGIEFREALKILADKAGVKLVPRNPQLESKKNRLLEICDWAAKFYHFALLRSQQGKIARDYLVARKIKTESVENFMLGYSPHAWDLAIKFLRKQGFQDQEIIEAGIATQKSGKPYDRFRRRLMFPINNVHGQVVGFGARVLVEAEDKLGKYINSPQTAIYDKSNVLYALDKAKQEIKRQNLCIAVEGYLDVIASHAIGVSNVISVSGTALALGQINLIKRYTQNLALCFDADLAGLQAAKRGITNAVAAGLNVRVILLPAGEDPDSLIRKDVRQWKKAILKSKAIMDFYFDLALKQNNPKTVEGKKLIAAELLPIIQQIPDRIEQAYYLQDLAEKIEIEEAVLREALPRAPRLSPSRTERAERPFSQIKAPNSAEKLLGNRILGIGLKHPRFLDEILREVKIAILPPEQQEVYKALKEYYNKDEGFIFADFKRKIKASDPDMVAKIDVAVLAFEKDFSENVETEILHTELHNDLKRLKQTYLKKALQTLEQKIKDSERQGDQKALIRLTKQFSHLSQELAQS